MIGCTGTTTGYGRLFCGVEMPKIIDLTGQRFGRLVVLKRAENKGRMTRWLCLCDCGKTTISHAANLRNGQARSCGCYRYDRARAVSKKHDGKGTRLYRIWKNMRSRCNCKSVSQYKDYGGRGITVCDEWSDYKVFQVWALSNGYADNLTIDRIDTNGNYTPDNCKWSNHKEQNRNRRDNHIVDGKSLSEWAEITGLNYQTLVSRANRGCSKDEILSVSKLVCQGR